MRFDNRWRDSFTRKNHIGFSSIKILLKNNFQQKSNSQRYTKKIVFSKKEGKGHLQVRGEDLPTTRPSLLLRGPSHPSHRSNPSQAQWTHAAHHWVQIWPHTAGHGVQIWPHSTSHGVQIRPGHWPDYARVEIWRTAWAGWGVCHSHASVQKKTCF